MDINALLRKHLINIKPYSSARDEYTGKEGVFLDANENPFGSASKEAFNRYPDPLQKGLKEKLSLIKGIPATNIFLGNGSDEPIDLLIRAFCEPEKDEVVITPPTYGMYQVCAEINNAKLVSVPLTKDFDLDVEGILSAISGNSKIIFLCSPNNPTGNSLQKSDIITVLENFPGIVVIDEAYIDFAQHESYATLLSKYKNLVVLQTLSKAWGLAALRLGMAFADEQIISILTKIKYPYNINAATQKLVSEALDNEKWKNEQVHEILTLRDELIEKIKSFDQVEKVYPSDANFILVKIRDAKKIFDYLIEQKIIVRDRSKVVLCEDCLRITIGTKSENNSLTEALSNYFDK